MEERGRIEWKQPEKTMQFVGRLSEVFRYLKLKRESERMEEDMREKWKRSRTEVTLIRQDEVVEVIEEVEEKRVGKKYEKRKEDIRNRTRRMSWRRKIEGRRNKGIRIEGKKEKDGE